MAATPQYAGPVAERLRHAARLAERAYPGPVGEMLSRELLVWQEFGYRFGGTSLVMRLVADIEKRPIKSAGRNSS